MQQSTQSAVAQIEFVVRTMARTAIDNETYFGDLDAVVGDGDFGYSIARGFEAILAGIDGFDRSSGNTFLKKIALTITSKVGGTSGPLWGTAFLRAAGIAGEKTSLTWFDAVEMLKAAAGGIKQRGQSDVGDKTLLDALVPATEALESELAADPNAPGAQLLDRAADVADQSAQNTKTMLAKRGRASYSGERSIGTLDAGAVAIARILADLRDAVRA
jgi:dihydroxyacetone kinase phosphoprotein-dependent L subunit